MQRSFPCNIFFLVKMTIILIRHSKDHNNDSATYMYDAKLRSKGKKMARKLFTELIEKYGEPSKIYCSPFRRAVETAHEAMKLCKNAKIRNEPKIGRYFTRKEQKNPEIAPCTERNKPMIFEDKDSLNGRCKRFCEKIKKYRGKGTVVWAISHTIPMKRCVAYFKLTPPDWFDFLEFFVIE